MFVIQISTVDQIFDLVNFFAILSLKYFYHLNTDMVSIQMVTV